MSLKAGAGAAAAPGSIFSTQLVGTGGHRYSSTAATVKNGIGQTAPMTFTYGTI